MNKLKEELRTTIRDKKDLKALNLSYEKQIRDLNDMKNKTVADKHLVENMLNKQIDAIKKNKREIMEHYQTSEKQLKFELKSKSLEVTKLQDEIDVSNQYLLKHLKEEDDENNGNGSSSSKCSASSTASSRSGRKKNH